MSDEPYACASAFYRRLAQTLAAWSIPSIGIGVLLVLLGRAFWFGFGLQAALWGLIDTALVVAGRRRSEKRLRVDGSDAFLARLARTLRTNGYVDIGYIAAGVVICLVWGSDSAVVLGHGVGVAVQGGFLLVFDFLFAKRALAVRGADRR